MIKAPRKPTRKAIIRRTVYAAARESVKAELATATAEHDSSEYRTAQWQEGRSRGEVWGAIRLAEALGLLTWSEVYHLERRIERLWDASGKKWRQLHEQKYAHTKEKIA